MDKTALALLNSEVVTCRACPRLVEWRELVAREKRAAFADETYWGRPVPGYGDPDARMLIVGLAPAAHGGNRTGRVFTGDRSGDWLFASMFRTGWANQPTSVHRDDGLCLVDAYISAVVKCAPPANKPTTDERDRCLPYLVRELTVLSNVKVLVALGSFGWDGALRTLSQLGVTVPRPKPRFGHLRRDRARPLRAARELPPEPTEHVHRQTHRTDAGRSLHPRPSPGALDNFSH